MLKERKNILGKIGKRKSDSLTLGSDPELMLKRDSKLVSAIPIIKGTKQNPLRIEGGMVQHDNVNAEFGIDPASNENEWVELHRSAISQLDGLVGNDVKLSCTASAHFPESELECKEAKEFGCDPDYNAYTYDINDVDPELAEATLRSCGGHIHVGLKDLGSDMEWQNAVIRNLDLFLGVPSLLLDKDPTSHRRRELYGKAGTFRPNNYGVEYRTLGNFWISHPILTRLMWKLTRDSIDAGEVLIDQELVRETIDRSLKGRAQAITQKLMAVFRKDTEQLFIKALKLDHSDLYEAWGL